MARPIRLSDLQLRVLGVLWEEGEASVAAVKAALGEERPLATTTVATILDRLHGREIVTRRQAGRHYVYAPAIEQSDVRRTMVAQLTDRLFRGDPAELVSHLIREGEIDADELARLRRRIAKRGRRS